MNAMDVLLGQALPSFPNFDDEDKKEMRSLAMGNPRGTVELISSRSPDFAALPEAERLKIVNNAIETDKRAFKDRVVENYVRPAAQVLGTTAGGIGGTAFGGPVGGVVLGGTGYALGNKATDALKGVIGGTPKEYGSFGDEIINTSKEIIEGAALEAGGAGLGKAALNGYKVLRNKGLKPLVETAKKPVEYLTKQAPGSDEVIAAAERQAIGLTRAEASGSVAASIGENGLGKGMLSAGIKQEVFEKQAAQIENAITKTKGKTGAGTLTPAELGENIAKGKDAVGGKYKEQVSKLYNKVDEKIDGKLLDMPEASKAINQLAEANKNLTVSRSPALKYAEELQGGNKSFQELKTIRSKISEEINKEMVENGYSQTSTVKDLTMLREGITADMGQAAENAGVGATWRRANKYHGYGKDIFEDNDLLKIIKKDPEKIPSLIFKPNSPTNVKRIMQTIPEETKKEVRRYMVDHVFTDAGEFGFSKAGTWFPKYETSLQAAFGKNDPILKDFKDLAAISNRKAEVYKKGGNPSGTGKAVDFLTNTVLGVTYFPALITKVLGERAAAKWWFQSPTFRKAVISAAKEPKKAASPGMRNIIGRIGGRAALNKYDGELKQSGINGANAQSKAINKGEAINAQHDPFGKSFIKYSGKPDEAVDYLLKAKQGYVPAAFHKEGVGDIDLVWGEAGKIGEKGGYGLAHIIRRRNEQGLNGFAFTRKIPDIIKNGKVYRRKEHPNALYIGTDKEELVIMLNWKGEEKKWLLTGYEIFK